VKLINTGFFCFLTFYHPEDGHVQNRMNKGGLKLKQGKCCEPRKLVILPWS
jgi:hypothetical protein